MNLNLFPYLITLLSALIASNKAIRTESVAVANDNQTQISMAHMMGLLRSIKVKPHVRSHDSALQHENIEQTVGDDSSSYSKDHSNDPIRLLSISKRDVRLPANRTSPTIYHGNFRPFAFVTQNPRSNLSPVSSEEVGNHFEQQNKRPASDGVPSHSVGDKNDTNDTQQHTGIADVRLPENRTSRTIYSGPQVFSTTLNPSTETNMNYPLFVGLNEQTLDHLERFLPSLVATDLFDPMMEQTRAVVPPNNCSTNNSVQTESPSTLSSYVSTNNMAELQDDKPLSDLYSRWMDFGIDRISDTTTAPIITTANDNSDGNPRLLFLSGIGNFLALRALSKDNVNTTRLSNPTTAAQISPSSTPRPRLMIVHQEDDKQKNKVDQYSEGLGDNLDIISAFQRCAVFPACTLKISLSPSPEPKRNGYDRLLDVMHSIYQDPKVNDVEIICDPTYVSVIISLAIVLLVVIIVSNILIIIVTLRTKNLRKPHGYFKISLALADLVNGAFVLPNVCSNLTRYIWFDYRDVPQLDHIRRVEPSYSESTFFGICAVVSQVVTVYSVLLLSVDSFLSVRWPLKYRVGDLMTPKRAAALVIAIWVFALAVSSLPLLADGYVTYRLSYTTFSYLPVVQPLSKVMSTEDANMARFIHVLLYAIFVWGIPFFCTWVLTILTAYYSRGMLRTMSMARKSSRNFAITIGRLERDIMRTVSVVLTLLTIAVLPILVAMVIIFINIDQHAFCIEQYVSDLLFAGYYMLACGSFVNVIVYNACHKEFRRSTFDFMCDVITFLFARCCPKYCDMQPFKSNRYRRNNASARATTRTTLDHRKTRHGSHPSTIMSHGFRSSNWQTSIKSPVSARSGARTPNSVKSCQSACRFNMERLSATRTFSTETFRTTARDNCLSSSSAISPQTFRKLTRNQSSSLSDVFLPSPSDPTPLEAHVKTKSID